MGDAQGRFLSVTYDNGGAAVDGLITRQAAVLSSEHVFQVIALVFLIALPFLPYL
jgi:hypothetical protein